HPLVLGRIARFDRKRVGPVLPVLILEQNCDGRTDGAAVAHSGENVRLVALNLHAPATTVTLLTPPEFAVEKRLIDFQTGGHTGEKGNQRFSVRLTSRVVAQH